MTMKEFMNAVVKADISAELTAYAIAEIKKIDDKNKARKTKQTATQKANAEFLTEIIAGMTVGQIVTAGEIASKFGVSTQKASAILQGGVKSGDLTSAEVKVKGKGKVIGYSAVFSDTQTEEDSADESADSTEKQTPINSAKRGGAIVPSVRISPHFSALKR